MNLFGILGRVCDEGVMDHGCLNLLCLFGSKSCMHTCILVFFFLSFVGYRIAVALQ